MSENNVEYVGFWRRVGASILDSIIIAIFTVPALIAIYGSGYFTDQTRPIISGPADFLISWVLPAVAIVLFWVYKRATPGKMAVSAQVIDARTGNNVTAGQAIGRYLAYFVSGLPLGLGFIWVAFDKRKQGWHDKLAKTVVVRPKEQAPAAAGLES